MNASRRGPNLDAKCAMRCCSLTYCARLRRPSVPAPSHRARSGGDVRHSCSTAVPAVCGPASCRLDLRIQRRVHPPSCSERTQQCNQQGVLAGKPGGLSRTLLACVPLQSSGVYMLANEHRDDTGNWMRVHDSCYPTNLTSNK